MAIKTKAYQKLPGKWFTLMFTRRSLWLGPDHLLWVESNLLSESYKRFFYKDIQTLIMCRSSGQTVWTIVWGVLLLFSAGIALMVSGTPYVSTFFAAIWAVLLLGNLLNGPTCHVYLQTAVQLERISTLVRVRKSQKVLDRIKTLVLMTQGDLDRSVLVKDSGRLSSRPLPRAVPAMPKVLPETDAVPYRPHLHYALFGLLLAMGVVRGAQTVLKWISLGALDMLGLACTLILAILVLVRSHRQVRNSLVASVDWLVLVFAALHFIASYGFFMAASLRHPGLGYNYWAVFKTFLELLTTDHPAVRAFALGIAGLSLALGIAGLIGMMLRVTPSRGRAATSSMDQAQQV